MTKYEELYKKYDEFAVPAYKIFSSGVELSKDQFGIESISVDLTVGDTCGACRFTVIDIYEHSTRKISSDALDKLKPGSKIDISLGYKSTLTKVFTGYVNELKFYRSEIISLVVTCLDVRGLMRENMRQIIYKDKSIQDIADEIINNYKALISTSTINVPALEQEISITQTTDDLDFLINAANNRGLLLYIVNDKLIIDKPSNDICVEFTWDEFEMEFCMNYLDSKINSIGYDAANMKQSTVTQTVKQKARQATLMTTEKILSVSSYHGGDFAKAVVDARAEIDAREALSGKITCQGIPDVILGQKVKINKFPLSEAGAGDSFTVTSISHRIDSENGYATTIGING